MKIAILTITGGQNFGNRLQNFALEKKLREYTDQVETVVNLTRAEDEYKLSTRIKLKIKKLISVIYGMIPNYNNITFNNWRRRFVFEKFTKKYIHAADVKISSENIPPDLADRYDYFVAGSDQIWNPYYLFNSHIEFMDFAEEKQRISYAASFGVEEIPTEKKEMFSKWLKGIPHISVREQRGKEIVEELTGRRVETVLDPTLLLDGTQWASIEKKPKWLKKEEYILAYFLGSREDSILETVNQISDQYHLPVIRLNDNTLKNEYAVSPEEFLYLVHHCRLMCTDSYHGIIFSYQMNRPVVIFDRALQNGETAMNSRIHTVEQLLGVGNREISKLDYKNEEILFHCDYRPAKDRLVQEKKKADEFLKKGLHID